MTERGGRSYPLGNRNKQYREGKDQVSQATLAWNTNELGRFVILKNQTEIQVGPAVRLYHPIPGRAYGISWELTSLTEAEIVELKKLFDLAFELALPVCIARDKEAADAFERGDDSYHRVYRGLPQVVYRKRTQQEHSEGVHDGSEDATDVEQDARDSDESVRDGGDGLAERNEGRGEPQDNWPTPHQPPSLRPVDGESDSSA